MLKIAVLPGDGIGPEIIREGVKVLKTIAEQANLPIALTELLVGGRAIEETGVPLPEPTLTECRNSDAVLLGAVGGPKWDNLPGNLRPEQALLGLRKGLNLFSNLRPVKVFKPLITASTLKKEVVEDVDLLVIRELTGGIYFGEKKRELINNGIMVTDQLVYTTDEIERIVRLAFATAKKRRRKLTSVDKANILESSRVWREVVENVAKDYPDVEYNHLLVDNAAMQLVRNPKQFDVIVTENMFGDILSDEAAMLTGSIGMLPSASLGIEKLGMYEPIHGSAPDIAGLGIANPLATILSVAMMFRYSFNMEREALLIEKAVEQVLLKGYRTKDLATTDAQVVTTEEMGDLVIKELSEDS